LAIKFSHTKYWNPAEWVSRTLFKAIAANNNQTLTEFEKELKEIINHQIKLYVWLLDFESYEPYKLEVFKEIMNGAILELDIENYYREGFHAKIDELNSLLDEEIKERIENPKWNEINNWTDEGIIRKRHLEEWAFSEDGVLHDQHEDYLLSKPDCLMPLFELLGMKWNRRNDETKNILIDCLLGKNTMHDRELTERFFKNIVNKVSLNKEQEELIERIKSS